MAAAGDRIELRGLRLLATVGVLDHERSAPQPVEIDVDLVCDLAVADRTDDLGDTVDYGDVCARIDAIARSRPFALLETLAESIAAELLADDRVEAVEVSVRKLRPPVPQQIDTSGVRLHRTR